MKEWHPNTLYYHSIGQHSLSLVALYFSSLAPFFFQGEIRSAKLGSRQALLRPYQLLSHTHAVAPPWAISITPSLMYNSSSCFKIIASQHQLRLRLGASWSFVGQMRFSGPGGLNVLRRGLKLASVLGHSLLIHSKSVWALDCLKNASSTQHA